MSVHQWVQCRSELLIAHLAYFYSWQFAKWSRFCLRGGPQCQTDIPQFAASNCCINKCLPVWFYALYPLPLIWHSAFLTFKPPLSLSLPFHLLHNLPHLRHRPPFPLSFSIHPSKDKSTRSLSSSCWHKFEAYLYRPLANINAPVQAHLAEGMCLMKARGTKLTVVSFSCDPCMCPSLKIANAHMWMCSQTISHLSFSPVLPPERACDSEAGPQSPVTVGGVSSRHQGGGLWQRHKSTSV